MESSIEFKKIPSNSQPVKLPEQRTTKENLQRISEIYKGILEQSYSLKESISKEVSETSVTLGLDLDNQIKSEQEKIFQRLESEGRTAWPEEYYQLRFLQVLRWRLKRSADLNTVSNRLNSRALPNYFSVRIDYIERVLSVSPKFQFSFARSVKIGMVLLFSTLGPAKLTWSIVAGLIGVVAQRVFRARHLLRSINPWVDTAFKTMNLTLVLLIEVKCFIIVRKWIRMSVESGEPINKNSLFLVLLGAYLFTIGDTLSKVMNSGVDTTAIETAITTFNNNRSVEARISKKRNFILIRFQHILAMSTKIAEKEIEAILNHLSKDWEGLFDDGEELGEIGTNLMMDPKLFPVKLPCEHNMNFSGAFDWFSKKSEDSQQQNCPYCRHAYTLSDITLDEDAITTIQSVFAEQFGSKEEDEED